MKFGVERDDEGKFCAELKRGGCVEGNEKGEDVVVEGRVLKVPLFLVLPELRVDEDPPGASPSNSARDGIVSREDEEEDDDDEEEDVPFALAVPFLSSS